MANRILGPAATYTVRGLDDDTRERIKVLSAVRKESAAEVIAEAVWGLYEEMRYAQSDLPKNQQHPALRS